MPSDELKSTNWQPIETAPKNGTLITANAPSWPGPRDVRFVDGEWQLHPLPRTLGPSLFWDDPTEWAEPRTTEFPPGVAYVEHIGWEEDEEHGRRFVARLCFPTGAPDLSAGVVWKRQPVKIEVQE